MNSKKQKAIIFTVCIIVCAAAGAWFALSFIDVDQARVPTEVHMLIGLIPGVITGVILGFFVSAISKMVHSVDRIASKNRNHDADSQLNNAEAILSYKKLLDDGIITAEEFEEKKKELLK